MHQYIDLARPKSGTPMFIYLLLFILFIIILLIIIIIKTISWIRARTSFALLRSALICLRGSRTVKRVSWDLKNSDIEIEATEGAIR